MDRSYLFRRCPIVTFVRLKTRVATTAHQAKSR